MQKDHIINVHTNNKFQLRALKTDRDTKTYCNVNVCTNPFLLRGRSNTLLNFKRGKGQGCKKLPTSPTCGSKKSHQFIVRKWLKNVSRA